MDAGANIGTFALLASRLVGKSGTVVAIEPEPHNAIMLKKNIELNDANNVLVIEKALWSEAGLTLRISDEQVMSRIGTTGKQVNSTTLDELEKRGIKPSALKMDVEGSEGAALSAGRQALQSVTVAELEVHDQLNMKVVEDALT